MSAQLDLSLGMSRQANGIARVSVSNADWIATARSYARRRAVQFGTVTSDDVRIYMSAQGFFPTSPAAHGAIFKEPGWRTVDRRKSELVGNHGRHICVYEWVGAKIATPA